MSNVHSVKMMCGHTERLYVSCKNAEEEFAMLEKLAKNKCVNCYLHTVEPQVPAFEMYMGV